MNEENEDGVIIENDEEETTIQEEVETPEENSEEEIDWKARAEKAEKIAHDQKLRAEKAEGKFRKVEVAPKQTKQSDANLSTKDLYALTEAKVPFEDIDEVAEYARFAKISVAEALSTNVVKTILKDKAEMRNVAEATNTGSARRTSGKVSEDALLDRASKGEMPESDEDIARLVAARRNRK